MPMSAMTRSPACVSAGGNTSGIFGAASVTVIDASTAGPSSAALSADRPVGTSMATIGTPRPLRSATTVSSSPVSGPRKPVPRIASTTSSQSDSSPKCSSHSCALVHLDDRHANAAEDLEVRAHVAPHVGHAPEQEHCRVDAALHERAGDHEAVAAVVAAAAYDGDAARRQVVERGLHGRHGLTAGVLHQHDRRNADVFDRAAIRLAHLFGVEHSHASVERTCLC